MDVLKELILKAGVQKQQRGRVLRRASDLLKRVSGLSTDRLSGGEVDVVCVDLACTSAQAAYSRHALRRHAASVDPKSEHRYLRTLSAVVQLLQLSPPVVHAGVLARECGSGIPAEVLEAEALQLLDAFRSQLPQPPSIASADHAAALLLVAERKAMSAGLREEAVCIASLAERCGVPQDRIRSQAALIRAVVPGALQHLESVCAGRAPATTPWDAVVDGELARWRKRVRASRDDGVPTKRRRCATPDTPVRQTTALN